MTIHLEVLHEFLYKKGMLLLWVLANHNSFRQIYDKFDVSQGLVHNVILEMLDCACAIAECYIVWSNDCQKTVQAVLYRRAE